MDHQHGSAGLELVAGARSWLDLVTGAMSRPRGRDRELGGDFSFQLQQMISSSHEAPATNKSLLLY